MANSDPAIFGVQSCGCITLAIVRPDEQELSAKEQREQDRRFGQIIREGGEILRTTVAAKLDPNFLPVECPHDPKGWEPS